MKLRKPDIIVLLIILFPIIAFLDASILSYYDEITGIIGILYVSKLFVEKKLNKNDIKILRFLTAITLVGILSNIFSEIPRGIFETLVDIVLLWKIFMAFILYQHLIKRTWVRNYVVTKLKNPAKLVILFNVFLSVIQQFIDIGVGITTVTGAVSTVACFKQYGFFWHFGIQTGWLLFICITILAMSDLSKRKFIRYLIISLIPLLLTFSSLVYCWIFVTLFLLWILRENTVFKIRYIVILAAGILCFASADIAAYTSNTAPRMILLNNGIQLANKYFPLGAGFATYGSEMANRYYSPIYISLGWEDTWAFGREGRYLNDNYIATIIGQFGWIGLLFFIGIMYDTYKTINSKVLTKRERAVGVSSIITIGVVMLGSGAAKTMMGVGMFTVLGVLTSKIQIGKEKVKGVSNHD